MADDDARELALREARRQLDNQVQIVEGIDDKAMRTVRTAVLILGFVASTLGIAGPDALRGLSLIPLLLLSFGVLCLFTAALTGIGTYAFTEYTLGISIDEMQHDPDVGRTEWLDEALASYEQLIGSLEGKLNDNSEFVVEAQFALLAGVSSLLIGASMTLVTASYAVTPAEQLLALLLAVATESILVGVAMACRNVIGE